AARGLQSSATRRDEDLQRARCDVVAVDAARERVQVDGGEVEVAVGSEHRRTETDPTRALLSPEHGTGLAVNLDDLVVVEGGDVQVTVPTKCQADRSEVARASQVGKSIEERPCRRIVLEDLVVRRTDDVEPAIRSEREVLR